MERQRSKAKRMSRGPPDSTPYAYLLLLPILKDTQRSAHACCSNPAATPFFHFSQVPILVTGCPIIAEHLLGYSPYIIAAREQS